MPTLSDFRQARPGGAAVLSDAPARLPLLEPSHWHPDVLEAMDGQPIAFNALKAAANCPSIFPQWLSFGLRLSTSGSFTLREREIIIFRLAARTRADYEWGAHRWVTVEVRAVLTESEVSALAEPDRGQWAPREQAIVDAVDSLVASFDHEADAWAALEANGFAPSAMVELMFLVGNYMIVAMVTKAGRIPREPGLHNLPHQTSIGQTHVGN